MHPFTLDPTRLDPPETLVGAVLTEEVSAHGRRIFHKGHRLTEGDLYRVGTIGRPIHAVRLAPDDVHEDEAGHRLATAVGGDRIEIRGPVQSRYNLVAAGKGLLRVDAEAVIALNRLDGIAVFTLQDRLPVLPGKIVAGAKITPVAIPEATLAAAEALATSRPLPVVRVAAFQPLVVGVITTEGMSDKVRDRFRDTVRRKIGWYGSQVLRFVDLPNDAGAVAREVERLIAEGANLILTAGGNTIDPLDPALLALERIGAKLVSFGAPAHPGSMFWLAYRDRVPIFNLASCSMYSKATVADLILPWVMAGEQVTRDDLATLGYGGLLDRDMGYRFPAYDVDHLEESDEE